MGPSRVSRLSRLEAGLRTVLAFTESFNQHQEGAMLQVLSTDCVLETAAPAPGGTQLKGSENLEAYWLDLFKEFPVYHRYVEEIFGLGNRCILRWRDEWGEIGGEEEQARGVDIFNVRDGLICEILSYTKN